MIFSALSKLSPSFKMTLLSVLAVSFLAGCGIRGPLKTPPPVFGEGSKVDTDRVPTDDLDIEDEEDDDFPSLDQDPLADF